MRELKFRVWNGMEMIHDVTVGKFGTFYVNPTNNGLDPNDSASLTPNTTKYSNEIPVMQFTGLHDKDGKEIWEGDILRDGKGGLGEVEYRQPQFVVWADGKHFALAEGKINMINLEYTEVVGNIYSNPELRAGDV